MHAGQAAAGTDDGGWFGRMLLVPPPTRLARDRKQADIGNCCRLPANTLTWPWRGASQPKPQAANERSAEDDASDTTVSRRQASTDAEGFYAPGGHRQQAGAKRNGRLPSICGDALSRRPNSGVTAADDRPSPASVGQSSHRLTRIRSEQQRRRRRQRAHFAAQPPLRKRQTPVGR